MTNRKSPDRVLNDASLTKQQKIDELKRWKYDLEQLSVATEENMPDLRPDDDETSLRDVVLALESLGYVDDERDTK